MSVQGQSLGAGQQVIFAIGVSPTGLQTAQPRILKLGHGLFQPVRRGNKIRIKYTDKFTGRRFQSFFQRSSFVAASFGAEDTLDVEAAGAIFFYKTRGEQGGVIG